MTVLPADPGSVSHLAGALRRDAASWRARATALDSALSEVAGRWPGRSSVEHRRHAAAIAEACRRLADVMDDLGTELQGHATELTEYAASRRAVTERAEGRGLQVEGDTVDRSWGITGTASPLAEHELADAAEKLSQELRSANTLIARRRERLRSRAAAIREEAAAIGTALAQPIR